MDKMIKRKMLSKTVAFLTLGCKVNFYETEKMMQKFIDHGFLVVDFSEDASVYVINTCTVTNIADRKSRQMIHRVKKSNPESLVAAVGCYVQAAKDVLEKEPFIDLVIGNDQKEQIYDIIMDNLGESFEDSENLIFSNEDHLLVNTRTRAYVKIQNGCNQFCSYCIIPYVRGKLISRGEEDVLKEIRELVNQGVKEVVLTGIHLSSYGIDFTNEKSFVDLKGKPLISLLDQLDQIDGLQRIRLGSLEPRIITDEFVGDLVKLKKVCPHFHLSLQSGSKDTLIRMNRKYTPDEYKDKCKMIRKYYENPAITTDVIVGFPGETEEEFEQTKKFVKEILFADIHVFKYSVRKGTKAESMPNQVKEEMKNHRSNEMIEIKNNLSRKYRGTFIGTCQKVLIEEQHEIDKKMFFVGHNERYVKCAVSAENVKGSEENKLKENEIVDVFVDKDGKNSTLYCFLQANE